MDRGPAVAFPPPLVFVAGLAMSWVLERRLEFLIDGSGAGAFQTIAGIVLIAAGVGLMLWGMTVFTMARTAVYPNRRARTCVTTGPYRFTRNPMYLGLTLGYLGLTLTWNNAWPLILLPVVLVALHAFVIAREERYMRAEFGAGYDEYCRRVRRWI